MASFDILQAAGYGYRQAWRERRYLARLAAVPLIVDVTGWLVITYFGWNTRFLLQALVLLPSYFAQGWMLSHYVRTLFFGQRWPFRPSGEERADRQELAGRIHGVGAGTLTFAVSRFVLAGVVEILYRLEAKAGPVTLASATAQPMPPALALAAVAVAVVSFWAFRLLWMFIPAALDAPMMPCLRRLRGFGASFYMGAAALLCFLPLMAAFGFVMGVASAPFGDGPPPMTLTLIFILIRSVMDMCVAPVVTGAMAQGLRLMLSPPPASVQR